MVAEKTARRGARPRGRARHGTARQCMGRHGAGRSRPVRPASVMARHDLSPFRLDRVSGSCWPCATVPSPPAHSVTSPSLVCPLGHLFRLPEPASARPGPARPGPTRHDLRPRIHEQKKFESFERSIPSRLHELHESKFPFVSRIELIVRNFLIVLLMYTGSQTRPVTDLRSEAASAADRSGRIGTH